MPSDFRFEPRSLRYGLFLVLGLFDNDCALLEPFLAIFGLFLGHIVELEGKKGLLVTRKSRHMWSALTISLHWSVLSGFWGRFGPKKAVLVHKLHSFGRSPRDLPPPPRGATAGFLAEHLDLARLPPRL